MKWWRWILVEEEEGGEGVVDSGCEFFCLKNISLRGSPVSVCVLLNKKS